MKRINPHDEIKGSNPSPGAYLKTISEFYKANESKNQPMGELKAQTSTTDNYQFLYRMN
jgi:hypothetical protein